MLGWLTVANFL